MNFREARAADIGQMIQVRLAVKENVLFDPARIPYSEYEAYLAQRGKGWVCERDGIVVGFAVADLQDFNIWALFVTPGCEGMGIGKTLHGLMLDWYFSKTQKTVWLSTAPASRAEAFYRRAGWRETGRRPNGEIRFEMTYADWNHRNASSFSSPHT